MLSGSDFLWGEWGFGVFAKHRVPNSYISVY
jgi:hypothetical protein